MVSRFWIGGKTFTIADNGCLFSGIDKFFPDHFTWGEIGDYSCLRML